MIAASIHAAGIAVYFVFSLLLFAASRVPRSSRALGYWAIGTFAACCARLMLLLEQSSALPAAIWWYACFIVLEKLCLLLGVQLFFGYRLGRRRWWLVAAGVVIAGFSAVFFTQLARLWFDLALAAFNVLALLVVCWIIWHRTTLLPPRVCQLALAVSVLLAVNWACLVPGYLWILPQWQIWGFAFGTLVVLVQYLALLAAVFVQFRRRLLDSEEKALALAFQDPLTGLNNKRYVDVLFEQALLLANRPHQLLAVFYIDLDHFKPINDNDGHRAGDAVLKEVARRLKQCLRSTDICARVGGDEFVVVATQLEHEQAAADIAGKILQQLATPVQVAAKTYQLGASVGISLYPKDGHELSALLEKADFAMYQVKKSGRHGYRLFNTSLTGEKNSRPDV